MNKQSAQYPQGVSFFLSMTGHEGVICRIAWSADGTKLASPSRDGTVRVWSGDTGSLLRTFNGHQKSVVGLSWSPDGKRIASCGTHPWIHIWEVVSGKIIRSLSGHSGEVNSIAWSPDGTKIITSAISEATLLVWDAASGQRSEMGRQAWGATYTDVHWSPDGRLVASACGKQIHIWTSACDELVELGEVKQSPFESQYDQKVNCLAWSPDSKYIAAGQSKNVAIWDVERQVNTNIIEGHTDVITGISYSADQRVLATKSTDGTVRLWRTRDWAEVGRLSERTTDDKKTALAFHPELLRLATLGRRDRQIRLWEIDTTLLLGEEVDSVIYTSAKVVLVGESNVGKSCLAMRLAEDRYPEDHEQGTTHGMRFWPMEAEDLHTSAKPPEGQRRDVVLWDFGGQDEYQLVHQMFLHDTTLALVLIDPTRGRAALEEAKDWSKRLEKHLGRDKAVKLLVGAKVDRKSKLIDYRGIENLLRECTFKAFIDLSAKTGRNTRRLRKAIVELLDWDQMAKTRRPELFQYIRDDIERRRKNREIVLKLETFKRSIRRSAARLYEEAAVEAVSDQLARQGIIVRTKLTGGDEALVLQLPVIERYAGSLIIAARNNPRGVPVLEERLLGSTKTIPLPGMTRRERISPAKERMVLECIVELMIQHGISFRHGGLLVFPALFPVGTLDEEALPHSVSLYYDFTGAIDNIYASLVSKLMVSGEFGTGRLQSGRVEFERQRRGICGIRQIKKSGGFAHVDLYFSETTPLVRRNLFTRFVESHLSDNGVEIREHQAIKCQCGKVIDEEDVQANMAAGETDVICTRCRRKTLISEGARLIRERDPESDQKMMALRKKINQETAKDIASAKMVVARGLQTSDQRSVLSEPIRLLHLSDLHFTAATIPRTMFQWLVDDLEKDMNIEHLEYLVLSGDVTDRGDDDGFDKGREFVELLIEHFGLSAQRCIFVPGNHDVQDRLDAYRRQRSAVGYPEDHIVRQGQIILARDSDKYPKRLQQFSNAFYHKIVQLPYPLETDQQGQALLFEDTCIQFLALNSAWEIDEFNRGRSGIAPAAVAHAIQSADRQVKAARERGELKQRAKVLRIAVWHHSVAGPEMMANLDFISNLQKSNVKLCLHGDVHDMRIDLVGYKTGHEMQVVGAGSFGSPAASRPESTPRLYNLLEIQRDHSSIRVHTRRQRKPEGAWSGWYEWTDPEGGNGRVAYFDIAL